MTIKERIKAGPAPGRVAIAGRSRADRREDAGANDGADAQRRDVDRTESFLQAVLGFLDIRHQLIQALTAK